MKEGKPKGTSMLGGAGKDTVTPETTDNKGTGTIRASSGGAGLQKGGRAAPTTESTNQVL